MKTNQKNSSKAKYGTLTATQDANNDYSSSITSSTGSTSKSASKAKYGTLTATQDANNEYK